MQAHKAPCGAHPAMRATTLAPEAFQDDRSPDLGRGAPGLARAQAPMSAWALTTGDHPEGATH